METKIDKWRQSYIEKYGERSLLDGGIIYRRWEDELKDLPINNIDDLGMHLCEILECKSCPVCRFNYDMRVTESDKEGLLCCENLTEWIIDQAQLTCKDRLDEYRRTVIYEPAESEQTSDTISE